MCVLLPSIPSTIIVPLMSASYKNHIHNKQFFTSTACRIICVSHEYIRCTIIEVRMYFHSKVRIHIDHTIVALNLIWYVVLPFQHLRHTIPERSVTLLKIIWAHLFPMEHQTSNNSFGKYSVANLNLSEDRIYLEEWLLKRILFFSCFIFKIISANIIKK